MTANGQTTHEPKVFIGMPAYLGVQPAALQAADRFATQVDGRCLVPKVLPFSHHCGSFNALWCTALNVRKEFGLTHFVMHHQDVAPELWYVDKLLAEMARAEADCLCVVLPIKDEKGMTSTAVLNRDTLCTRRLSMAEVHQLPPTFTAADLPKLGWKNHLLLPVAGLFICRFDESWVEKVWFESASRIVRDQAGTFVSAVWDEGWNVSIQMQQLGVRVAATRAICANHLGGGAWGNEEPWGEWVTDACETDQSWILSKTPEQMSDSDRWAAKVAAGAQWKRDQLDRQGGKP